MPVPLDATNPEQVTEEFLRRFEKDRQKFEPAFLDTLNDRVHVP
ncbi:hypothetical protein [Cystobacter ferrugineus]|nr:hypothetical protein [Cystobacter ferrugineus]